MDKYLDIFRINMKYYREKLRFSQTQLSKTCNCGTGTIGGIESGKAKPSFEMMIKIAEALKINPADLFIRDVSKTKKELYNKLKTDFDNIFQKSKIFFQYCFFTKKILYFNCKVCCTEDYIQQ